MTGRYENNKGSLRDAFIRVIDEMGGTNNSNGMTALNYARMRKATGDSDSDIARIDRQRKLVKSVIDKLKMQGPGFALYVSNQVLPLITTSMSTSEITDLILTLLPMLPDLTINKGGTCPAESRGDMVDIFDNGQYHSVLRFDQDATIKTMRVITDGEMQ